MGLGIGIGIGSNTVTGYPTENLSVIIYNTTYEDGGTTYLRTSSGTGIPKVGGTGLDTIWDFSVLSDARFDKGSYVGNAYGLPEYYDFPFVNIYFDETSEATRYHWKLTDFHYANILAQSLLLDNTMFLRAKATTETSNEISEIYQLNIYESEQTGAALTKLKTWMRVQTFEGENNILNSFFDLDNEGDIPSNWEKVKSEVTWEQRSERGYYNHNDLPTLFRNVHQIISFNKVKNIIFEYDYFDCTNFAFSLQERTSSGSFIGYIVLEGNKSLNHNGTGTKKHEISFTPDENSTFIYIAIGSTSADGEGSIDNVCLFYKYVNYYKP